MGRGGSKGFLQGWVSGRFKHFNNVGGFGGGGAFVWQKEAEEHVVDEDIPKYKTCGRRIVKSLKTYIS